MMRKLDLFAELSVPVDVATDRWVFLGNNGSGKTYCASKLCELLIDAGVQVGVLDVVGIHYNLRRGARGGPSGKQVIVFGGKHADIPITPMQGAIVADAVLDLGCSYVVDLSQFRRAERFQFLVRYAEQLWTRVKARSPKVLFQLIEEAHVIVAEKTKKGTGAAACAEEFEEITQVGRNHGVGIGFITTRPQEVKKSVLHLAGCLVAFQTGGPSARKAIDEWMSGKELGGEALALCDRLAQLKVGEGVMWSPRTLEYFGPVHALPKETFDGGRTPKVGEHIADVKLAPVDLDLVRERLKATIEQAERNDPAVLQRKVDALEAEVTRLKRAPPVMAAALPPAIVKAKEIVIPKVLPKHIEKMKKANSELVALVGKLDAVRDRLAQSQQVVVSSIDTLVSEIKKSPLHVSTPIGFAPGRHTITPEQSRAAQPSPETKMRQMNRAIEGRAAPSRTQLKFLEALVMMNTPNTSRANLARMVGMIKDGGGFRNVLSSLRTAGWMDGYDDAMQITDLGRQLVPEAKPHSPAELAALWARKLRPREYEVLQALIARGGTPCKPIELASALVPPMVAEGGGFRNLVSALRSRGLLHDASGDQLVAAAELLG